MAKKKALTKKAKAIVALPTVAHANSVNLDNEKLLVRGFLKKATEAGDSRSGRVLLELLNTINRASAKFDEGPTRTKKDLRKLCLRFISDLYHDLDFSFEDFEAELLPQIEGLRNV